MTTLKTLVLEHCQRTDEYVVGFVVGLPIRESGYPHYIPTVSEDDWRKVLKPEELNLLDYDLSRTHGINPNAVYVWTNRSVLFVLFNQQNHEGTLHSLPRDPIECMPEYL
jgi:hypothetical protein